MVGTVTATIWKFPLHVEHFQQIRMPRGAEAISLQGQRGQPCLWVVVDPLAPPVSVPLLMVGTGHTIPPGYPRHLGTWLETDEGNSYVWHFFGPEVLAP